LNFLPKLSDCRGCRYSRLFGCAFDAVDAVRSAIPEGFKF
jgi:hypothetical protein